MTLNHDNIYYLSIIACQFTALMLWAGKLANARHGTRSVQFALCLIGAAFFAYEFWRELQIASGAIYYLNHGRLVLLRVEHFVMGMLASDIVRHLQYAKTSVKTRKRSTKI